MVVRSRCTSCRAKRLLAWSHPTLHWTRSSDRFLTSALQPGQAIQTVEEAVTNCEVIECLLSHILMPIVFDLPKQLRSSDDECNGNFLKHELTHPWRAIEMEGRQGGLVRTEASPPHTEGRPPWTLINSRANGYSSKVH